MYLFEPRVDRNDSKHCLNCDAILSGRRKRYCSDDCRREFWAKHSWSVLRMKVIREADFTCVKCGYRPPKSNAWPEEELVVDHIEPIFAGGKEFDKNNLQVLCKKCNVEKTKKDMKRYHELRRDEQKQAHVSQYHRLTEFNTIGNSDE